MQTLYYVSQLNSTGDTQKLFNYVSKLKSTRDIQPFIMFPIDVSWET
jgi:hypothetical protein